MSEDFSKEEISVLSQLRDTKEIKSVKNLLSRKALDWHELDEIMNPGSYF